MQMDGPSPGVLGALVPDGRRPVTVPRAQLFRGAQATISKAPQARADRVRIPGEDGHVADEPRRAATSNHRFTLGEDGLPRQKKSVWNGGDTFAELDGELDAEDLTDLKDIFSAKASTAPVRRKSPQHLAIRASPLDAKRAQNATIALAIASRKFRGDFDRVWRAVAECAAALPIDALERLQEVLTNKEGDGIGHPVVPRGAGGAAERACL